MLRDAESILKIYSIGIVVNDKELNSDIIDVYPVEELPLAEGSLKDTKLEYEQELPDSMGVPNKAKVEGKNYVKAKWIPFGHSNRITAPDVYANEHVILFKYADTGEFYWTTIFREPMFRRLETVCYMYSDLKEKMKEFTKDSSYWVEVSTHKGYIKVSTAKSNGEKFKYEIDINGKDGYFSVKDDAGNSITINSVVSEITVKAKTITLDCVTVNWLQGRCA